jgi:N-acetyl-anhydromuramyl-L-alanine amidase AmpD
MLQIDKNGRVQNAKVRLDHRFFTNRKGQARVERSIVPPPPDRSVALTAVNGIVVHQTGTPTRSVFGSYSNSNANRAHFLIDLDGTIYQTASVYLQAGHVGRLRARCLVKKTCKPTEVQRLEEWDKKVNASSTSSTHDNEKIKKHPERYPSNVDSIGIECTGLAWWYGKDGKKLADQSDASAHLRRDKEKIYDPLTDEQKRSLEWLIHELAVTFKVQFSEVFRHPEVSRKTPTEAISAQEIISKLQKEAGAQENK